MLACLCDQTSPSHYRPIANTRAFRGNVQVALADGPFQLVTLQSSPEVITSLVVTIGDADDAISYVGPRDRQVQRKRHLEVV